MRCRRCSAVAQVRLPSHNTGFCPECFFQFFHRQVERAIKAHSLLTKEDKVLVALSGGKDSLGLMLALSELGYDVTGLHVYLGIGDSSASALATVRAFCEKHGFALLVADTPADGLPIPLVKERVTRPICAVCGKIKRHAMNRAAVEGGFSVLATGHNLDDETARLFANTLRWDASFLSTQGPDLPEEGGFVRKVKPLYRLTEFETACYAFLRRIEYGYEPCPYSAGASFTGHKGLLEGLEETSPGAKIQFYDKFLRQGRPVFQAARQTSRDEELRPCASCAMPTPNEVCSVCRLRERLAKGEEADAEDL